MVIGMAQLTLDVRDLDAQARFWSSALGYRIDRAADGNVFLRSSANTGSQFSVWLQPVAETKRGKNRLHFDFDAVDPETEITRLLELGARRCDVGQSGKESFVVLADPEGNEFCVYKESRAARRAAHRSPNAPVPER